MFFIVCANTQSSSSLGTALSLRSDLCWWTHLESQCVVLLEMHSLQVPAGDPNPGRVMDFLSVVIAFRWPVIWLAQWGGRWGWVGGEGGIAPWGEEHLPPSLICYFLRAAGQWLSAPQPRNQIQRIWTHWSCYSTAAEPNIGRMWTCGSRKLVNWLQKL